MRLSISNIGWNAENDEEIYTMMRDNGFTGLEIAPTRVFMNSPYKQIVDAKKWSFMLKEQYGFDISSLQSIWYGKTEKIFSSYNERKSLIDYTKTAIDFASAIGCHNLVFGCPRNRVVDESFSKSQIEEIAVPFFQELGDYALKNDTVIAIEANPRIYNTNFINNTLEAIDMIEKVNSKGFLLNLDLGTMIENNESLDILQGKVSLINHIHISEPYLDTIQKRVIHKNLVEMVKKEQYNRFISIEMSNKCGLRDIKEAIQYLGGL